MFGIYENPFQSSVVFAGKNEMNFEAFKLSNRKIKLLKRPVFNLFCAL